MRLLSTYRLVDIRRYAAAPESTIPGDNGAPSGPNDNLGYGNEFIHDRNLRRFGYDLPIYSLVPNPGFDATKAPSPRNPRRPAALD